jgi:hypothetical protein
MMGRQVAEIVKKTSSFYSLVLSDKERLSGRQTSDEEYINSAHFKKLQTKNNRLKLHRRGSAVLRGS